MFTATAATTRSSGSAWYCHHWQQHHIYCRGFEHCRVTTAVVKATALLCLLMDRACAASSCCCSHCHCLAPLLPIVLPCHCLAVALPLPCRYLLLALLFPHHCCHCHRCRWCIVAFLIFSFSLQLLLLSSYFTLAVFWYIAGSRWCLLVVKRYFVARLFCAQSRSMESIFIARDSIYLSHVGPTSVCTSRMCHPAKVDIICQSHCSTK